MNSEVNGVVPDDAPDLDERDARDEAVVDADDTGLLGGERSLVEGEIEQALQGNPPPPRP